MWTLIFVFFLFVLMIDKSVSFFGRTMYKLFYLYVLIIALFGGSQWLCVQIYVNKVKTCHAWNKTWTFMFWIEYTVFVTLICWDKVWKKINEIYACIVSVWRKGVVCPKTQVSFYKLILETNILVNVFICYVHKICIHKKCFLLRVPIYGCKV